MADRPGLPENLDPPEQLWTRAAATVLLALTKSPRLSSDYSHDEGELGFWHSNGTWTLVLRPDGRALLYGQDVDCSDTTYVGDEPVDLLAGAPSWLPAETLRPLIDGYEMGYLYWWEPGALAWGRASYPDFVEDDGLAASFDATPGVLDAEELPEVFDECGYRDREVNARFLGRVLARDVDGAVLAELMNSDPGASTDDHESLHAGALAWAGKLGVAADGSTVTGDGTA
ncbi:hypothetical protein [Embleya sp. NPDC001921]